MEHLTKQQIILLTLLVSFITSIATGIVTVSLMNQAPVGVVQTINRVVEKTIETVTPPSKEIQTVVKETVTVNLEEQIVSAVEKNLKSVIRIYRTSIDPSSGQNSMVFVGLGTVVTDDGVIATDNSLINSDGKYFTTTKDQKLINLDVVKAESGQQVALLKIKKDEQNSIVFTKVNISNDDLKLGQTVIYIGGETKDSVSTGIISSLSAKELKPTEGASSTPITKISAIETSISSDFVSGGMLLNLSGELVGIKSTYLESANSGYFAPSLDVKDSLFSIIDSTKSVQ